MHRATLGTSDADDAPVRRTREYVRNTCSCWWHRCVSSAGQVLFLRLHASARTSWSDHLRHGACAHSIVVAAVCQGESYGQPQQSA